MRIRKLLYLVFLFPLLAGCGNSETSSTSTPVHYHDMEHFTLVAPACESSGKKEYYHCKGCEKDFLLENEQYVEVSEADLVIPATGHDLEHFTYVAPTCELSGKEEYYQCKSCEKFFVGEEPNLKEVNESELVISPLGHQIDEHYEYLAPTCEAKGYIEHDDCSRCGKHFILEEGTYVQVSDEDIEIAPNGHDYRFVEASESTCSKHGNKEHYRCNDCGKYFFEIEGEKVEVSEDDVLLDLLPHTFDENMHCTVCGFDGNPMVFVGQNKTEIEHEDGQTILFNFEITYNTEIRYVLNLDFYKDGELVGWLFSGSYKCRTYYSKYDEAAGSYPAFQNNVYFSNSYAPDSYKLLSKGKYLAKISMESSSDKYDLVKANITCEETLHRYDDDHNCLVCGDHLDDNEFVDLGTLHFNDKVTVNVNGDKLVAKFVIEDGYSKAFKPYFLFDRSQFSIANFINTATLEEIWALDSNRTTWQLGMNCSGNNDNLYCYYKNDIQMNSNYVYYLHVRFAGDVDVETLKMTFSSHPSHTYDEYGRCTGYLCEEYNGDFYLSDSGVLQEGKTALPYQLTKGKSVCARTVNDNTDITSLGFTIRASSNPNLSITVVQVNKNGNYSTVKSASSSDLYYTTHSEGSSVIWDSVSIYFSDKTYTGHLYVLITCNSSGTVNLIS